MTSSKMSATLWSHLVAVLLTILLSDEISGNEGGGALWFPDLSCRKDYSGPPFEVERKRFGGGDRLKDRASVCKDTAHNDQCLKFCVLEKMDVIYNNETGMKLNYLDDVLQSVYKNSHVARKLGQHIYSQCEFLFPADGEWNCSDPLNTEGLNCLLSYFNCTFQLQNYWPLDLYDLRCHGKEYIFRRCNIDVKRHVGWCRQEFPHNVTCAKACIFEKEGFGEAMAKFIGGASGQEFKAIAELANKLGSAGLRMKRLKNAKLIPSEYTSTVAQKLMRLCAPLFSKEMKGWFASRKQKKDYEGCDSGKWLKFVQCVDKILRCKSS